MNELDKLAEKAANDQVVLYCYGLNNPVYRAYYCNIPEAIERLETQRLQAVHAIFYD